MKTLIALAASLTLLAGCADFRPVFDVYDPITGQQVLHTAGGIMFSRKDSFVIKHEWLDQDNVLHEYSITRNTDEKADAQTEMLRLMQQLILQNAITGVGGGL